MHVFCGLSDFFPKFLDYFASKETDLRCVLDASQDGFELKSLPPTAAQGAHYRRTHKNEARGGFG
jgi:hypothetical protein